MSGMNETAMIAGFEEDEEHNVEEAHYIEGYAYYVQDVEVVT